MNSPNFQTIFPFLGLALLALVQNAVAQDTRRFEGEIDATQIRDHVHMLVMEPAGNVAVSIGDDGVFVIDDQFAPMTDPIIEAVGKLTEKPIRYVFNTHWHGDHAGGNANFANRGYTIVAHDNVRIRMNEGQYHLFFKAATPPHPEAAKPVITYSDTMTFHFNGDVVRVLHLPNAHTDGDSVFYFENADVLHTGDTFINRGYPLIDVASSGSIGGLIEATNRCLEIIGPETIIIPGHGPLADKARMIEIRDMLVETRSRVVALIDQGMTLDEMIAAKPLADLDAQWGQAFIKADAFVTIIYQSETGDWERP